MKSIGLDLITEERIRQIVEEGRSLDHDQQHESSQLLYAAICYASPEPIFVKRNIVSQKKGCIGTSFQDPWPYDFADKREEHSRIKQLQIAGALIAAELDRINKLNEAVGGLK